MLTAGSQGLARATVPSPRDIRASFRPPGSVHCDRRGLAFLDAVWLRHGAERIRQTVVMAELEVLLSVATGDGTAGVLRDEDGAVWLSWRIDGLGGPRLDDYRPSHMGLGDDRGR